MVTSTVMVTVGAAVEATVRPSALPGQGRLSWSSGGISRGPQRPPEIAGHRSIGRNDRWAI